MRSVRGAVAAVTLGLAALALAPTASAAGTTVVDETSLTSTWTTGDQRGDGALAFVTEYGAPAGLGDGALQLSTPGDSDKVQMLTAADLPLSALADASYWTYRVSGSGEQVPAINVVIDHNGPADGGFATLVFEPTYSYPGQVADGVWQRWDAGADASWWSTRSFPGMPSAFDSFVSLRSIIDANPDAVIEAFGVNAGSGNAGLLAAVDGLTVAGTTYDFEPRTYSKADCRDGGWASNFAADRFVNQGDCVSYFASGGRTHAED
ncbi:hypothetical protein [Aquipuribacter sp. SD81]|uniref:hypothetical protein n=1 Tax=Aquipuribacter sp. SD81 TaxID=3127703 RepID=UPI0030158C49